MKECDICGKQLDYGEWVIYRTKDKYNRGMTMLLCEECNERLKERDEKDGKRML